MAVRATILLADDDAEILGLLATRLRPHGYRILEARDGAEALRLAQSKRPDLVVLDVMMPNLSGWEVARSLRQDPSLTGIGIIMLTGIGELVNELTSSRYGADEYVDKPFDLADLERRIEALLARRRGKDPGSSGALESP